MCWPFHRAVLITYIKIVEQGRQLHTITAGKLVEGIEGLLITIVYHDSVHLQQCMSLLGSSLVPRQAWCTKVVAIAWGHHV